MALPLALVPARPIIDPETGNLNLHGRSGYAIAYKLQDGQGNPIALAGAAITLEIDGIAAIAGAPGPDAYTQIFVIPQATVAALPLDAGVPFAVVDATTWGQPTVLWSGWAVAYGYESAPP